MFEYDQGTWIGEDEILFNVMVCAIQLEQVAQLQFEEVRLGRSASAPLGIDAQNAVDV